MALGPQTYWSLNASAAAVVDILDIPTNPLLASSYTAPNNAGISTILSGVSATYNAVEALPAAPSVTEIVDGVWDETLASHLSSGSTGLALNSAGSSGDPWSTALPGSYGPGTAGLLVSEALSTPVSDVHTAVSDLSTQLGTPVGVSISADIAAIPTNPMLSTEQIELKKGVALDGFTFPMASSAGVPLTGLTVSGLISKNGGTPVATTNSVVEVGNGLYSIALTGAEMDAEIISLMFSASGAVNQAVTIGTQT